MKNLIIFTTALVISITTYACAQQKNNPVNDSLLLDYYQNQKFAEASDYLKSIYPEPVTNLKALSRLAYTAQMANKLPEAESYYQRLYALDSTQTGVLFSLASLNLKRGNLNKAFDYYTRITRTDSTNFIVYKQLARISAEKNDIPGCMTNLQKANKLNPQDADVAADLSDYYVSLKQLPVAEKVLGIAITADPENTVLLESLVKLEYAQKNWPGTIKAGEKLLQLGDNNTSMLIKLGQAYYFDKNYICGIETLAGIGPTLQNETSYYFTAVCYKQLKKQHLAIKYLNLAIEAAVSPAMNSYYSELADSFDNLKEIKKSIAAYKKSLEYQETPLVYYSLATIYDAELKDKKNAVKYYKKYLAAKPPINQQTYIAFTKSRLTQLNLD